MKIVDGLYVVPTDEQARKDGCHVDLKLPNKIIKFCERFCIQSKAPFAGKPLRLLPWQVALINTLYGWKRANGDLRFRRSIIFIPKKQGKSTLLAALVLFHLLQGEGSEVYCIASSIDQARIVYNQSSDFVNNNKDLDKRLWLRPHIKSIEDKSTKSILKILSSNATGKSGFSANFICCDELAEWAKHSARDVWDKIQDAGAARTNSLLVTISTAQFDKTHIGYEQYRRASKILSGDDDDTTTLPVIYEVSEHEDWKDPDRWWQALPSVDKTVPRSYYHDAYKSIQNNPLEETRFRTLLLNQWVGSAEQWIPSNVWQSCATNKPESKTYGQSAVIGIDMSRRFDLTATCVVVKDDDTYYCYPRFFIPRDFAQKKQEMDNVPYLRWATMANTNLYLTDGDVIDPGAIRSRIKHDAECWRIEQIRYDPYAMEETRQILEFQMGFNMCEVAQTPNSMSPAFNQVQTLVTEGKLKHPDNPILNWCLGNCRPKLDKNDRLMIVKSSDIQRIDGVDALAIALTYWLDDKNKAPAPPTGQQWAVQW